MLPQRCFAVHFVVKSFFICRLGVLQSSPSSSQRALGWKTFNLGEGIIAIDIKRTSDTDLAPLVRPSPSPYGRLQHFRHKEPREARCASPGLAVMLHVWGKGKLKAITGPLIGMQ